MDNAKFNVNIFYLQIWCCSNFCVLDDTLFDLDISIWIHLLLYAAYLIAIKLKYFVCTKYVVDVK